MTNKIITKVNTAVSEYYSTKSKSGRFKYYNTYINAAHDGTQPHRKRFINKHSKRRRPMNITDIMFTNRPATIYDTPVPSSKKTQTQPEKTFKDSIEESVVDTFKRRHPDSARHVDEQVRAGKAVRERHGAGISTEKMTMEEYQAYFYALLDTIPYDSTHMNDTNIISISEEGWEITPAVS